jgi:hypothetical protein
VVLAGFGINGSLTGIGGGQSTLQMPLGQFGHVGHVGQAAGGETTGATVGH